MKEYSKEEKINFINKINEMQKFVRKFKQKNGKEPSDSEIAENLKISSNMMAEIREILEEFKRQDEEFKLNSGPVDKDRVAKAREIRKSKKNNNNNKT